jgi:hypothetical protein
MIRLTIGPSHLSGSRAVTKLTGMASLLFRLRGRSPHSGPLVIGPHALAEALNQKGGRGRPSPLGRRMTRFV